ncbi:TDT family transporter [Conexibacter sp. DBS9H8]|uniref:TDT family transporter n=1 Tax=Conexibacter sp. DBS9H8 TaxID=2937801 RepID=UPI003530E992
MGTGIVATAAARLPIGKSTFHPFAVAVWVIAALLLILVTIAVVLHWVRFPATARSHARNPTMAPFYGAPPMALMTVGTGTLLLGRVVIGGAAALDVDWVLWSLGTVTGLLCTAAIPYLLFTQHEVQPDGAFGGWLMPIVPPMVSAANGALLIPHLHGAHAQATMLYGCYAMFGMSLVTAFIVITLIWSRLAHYGTSGSSRVPTLWIVLGPLGQSITAVGLLGTEAHLAVGPALSSALSTFAVLYGVPVFGFALLWSVLAAALTVRAIRGGMSFALTWWSFTFPVGTCVTGVTGLAIHTGLPAFRWAALIAFVALLAAWLTVAIQTVWGSVAGDLFLAPTADGPVRAAKAPVVS